MALNRAWYNALIDDDGSGLTGSVWDKADIKDLLDSVDAELARLDALRGSTLWTPALVSLGGGTPTYSYRGAVCAINGRLVWYGGRIILTSKGSLAAGALAISGLPYACFAGEQIAPAFSVGYFSGLAYAATTIGGYMDPATTKINLTWINTPGQTAITILDTSHITNTLSMTFGGIYIT